MLDAMAANNLIPDFFKNSVESYSCNARCCKTDVSEVEFLPNTLLSQFCYFTSAPRSPQIIKNLWLY